MKNKITFGSLLTVMMVCLLIGFAFAPPTASAQTPPIGPIGTNTPSAWAEFADQVTNIAIVPFYSYAKESHESGGGLMLVYNVSQNFGAGAAVEVLGKSVQVLSANFQFRLQVHPLAALGYSEFALTPWIGGFIGTPFGAGGNNGSLAAGAGGGVYGDFLSLGKGWNLGAGVGAVQWTGANRDFNTLHILGFGQVHKGF